MTARSNMSENDHKVTVGYAIRVYAYYYTLIARAWLQRYWPRIALFAAIFGLGVWVGK